MSGMQPVPDPYRVLGVARSATIVQVKAAHRALAKRYHPDAPDGDTARFLAVQNAYLLLSDPVRRRQWDASHEPGPVRAGESPPHGRTRGAAGRWTREGPDVGARRSARASTRRGTGPAPGATGRSHASADAGHTAAGQPPQPPGRDAGDRAAPGTGAWSASGRDPASRSHTWSAEGVPWWEDFPGARRRATPRERPGPAPGSGAPPTPDVYNRSSGAAWSSAARRYFRRSDSELPSRGSFRRQGTQYVTGARAREMAPDDQAPTAGPPSTTPPVPGPAETVLRTHPGRTPARQAFDHEPARTVPSPRAAGPMSRPATAPRQVSPRETLASRPARAPELRSRPRSRSGSSVPPDAGRRIAEVTLAWIPVAAVAAWGLPATAGCGGAGDPCPEALALGQALLATVALAAFAAFPALARIGALATVGGLAVAVPLMLIVASVGLLPPAPPIVAGAALMVAGGYVAAGLLAAAWVWRERRARGTP